MSGPKEERQDAAALPVKNSKTFQKEQDGSKTSEALKRKDQVIKERGASRRRVRGGAPTAESARGGDGGIASKELRGIIIGESEMREEAERVANL